MRMPFVMDIDAVVEALRVQGCVVFRSEAIEGDFGKWRRRVRRAACERGIRVRVRRVGQGVCVEDPDWDIPPDHVEAQSLIIGGLITGQPLSFEEAVEVARRQRLGAVK